VLDRYAQIKRNYVSYYVHRLICAMTHNLPYDGDWEARHTCNNKACVRVEHIVPGTHSDNMQDALRDGLVPLIARETVDAIIADTRSQRAIAADYGVTQAYVSALKRGKIRKNA